MTKPTVCSAGTGDGSPVIEPVSATLARIRADDERIHAWAYLAEPGAIPIASAQAGALADMVFGVKDVIDVAGMPTRCGSSATSDAAKPLDASCVAQLREAGALPIGKTVTAEFAYTSPGPTRNPHALDHTPGGSSSGSAAAVAAGMVDIALGTQTGGSIIRPAAFCGVVGFKPTFGRVHRQGMDVLCDSLDTIGWFSRTVAQSARVASVLLADPSPPPAGAAGNRHAPRVAVLPCRTLAPLSPAARQALDDCIDRLAALGATVLRPPCDDDIDTLVHIHAQIMPAELARALLPMLRAHGGHLSQALRDIIGVGLNVSYADYVREQQARQRLATKWQEQFADVDFIVTPSAPGEAPAGLASTGSSIFNRAWSLLGWPCLHLPTGRAHNGLPVGVQWVAKPDDDVTLLGWAVDLHA